MVHSLSRIEPMSRFVWHVLVSVSLWVLGCSDTAPFVNTDLPTEPRSRPQGADVVTFFALGDWGTGGAEQRRVAEALAHEVGTIPPGRKIRPFVVGLGDNVYPNGLPRGWDSHPEALAALQQTFGDVYKNLRYQGELIDVHVVPGNHDHAGRSGGQGDIGDVLHQETTGEGAFPNFHYYPLHVDAVADSNDSTEYAGLATASIFDAARPQAIPVTSPHIAMVGLDTQVLLDAYVRNDGERIRAYWRTVDRLFEAASDASWKMLLGHHPVESFGTHGGFRVWWWWVPPITIVTLVDKLLVKRLQDLDHPANRRFQEDLLERLERHDAQWYLAGHEHNLQFLQIGANRYHIISGSAGKSSPVSHGDATLFSHDTYGFIRFDVSHDRCWVEFFEVNTRDGSYGATGQFCVTGSRVVRVP